MIKQVNVINSFGDELELVLTKPELSGFWIADIQGLGPPSANINTLTSPTIDGARYNSANVGVRTIEMTLGITGFDNDDDTARTVLYRYFPIKKKIDFEVELSGGRVVTVEAYVESNDVSIFGKFENAVITLQCPDPYFMSTNLIVDLISGIQSLFQFPYSNNSLTEDLTILGEILLDVSKNVQYDGDVETGVLLHVHFRGNVDQLRIHNVTHGQSMIIDTDIIETIIGDTINEGDDLYINTKWGDKYVIFARGGQTWNVLNSLGLYTDWITISPGENFILYDADAGGSFVQLGVNYRALYSGV